MKMPEGGVGKRESSIGGGDIQTEGEWEKGKLFRGSGKRESSIGEVGKGKAL